MEIINRDYELFCLLQERLNKNDDLIKLVTNHE